MMSERARPSWRWQHRRAGLYSSAYAQLDRADLWTYAEALAAGNPVDRLAGCGGLHEQVVADRFQADLVDEAGELELAERLRRGLNVETSKR